MKVATVHTKDAIYDFMLEDNNYKLYCNKRYVRSFSTEDNKSLEYAIDWIKTNSSKSWLKSFVYYLRKYSLRRALLNVHKLINKSNKKYDWFYDFACFMINVEHARYK